MTSERTDHSGPFRVAFVPGVTPDKWVRRWAERMPRLPLELVPVDEEHQTAVLYDDRAEMCFVRLPVDQDALHVIPLYSEVPVVVVPRDHFVEAADEVSVSDLADEYLLKDPDITTKQAIETVAAGVGIVIVPMSVARLHHRKDVVHRPVSDLPETRIGLAWRRDLDDERVDTFVGIVRGRTANSSRGEGRAAPQKTTENKAQPRRSARGRRRR